MYATLSGISQNEDIQIDNTTPKDVLNLKSHQGKAMIKIQWDINIHH